MLNTKFIRYIYRFLFVSIAAFFVINCLNWGKSTFGEKNKKSLWDVQIDDIEVSRLNKKNKTRIITYKLAASDKNTITPQSSVWVFVKFSPDGGKTWMNTDDTTLVNDLIPENRDDSLVNKNLSGDVGIVESSGKKTIIWQCGDDGTGFENKDVLVRIRVIQMCRMPADDKFEMGGNGAQAIKIGLAKIDQFYLAKYPAAYVLYAEFLNEWGNFHDPNADDNHRYWCNDMSKEEDGGLEIKGQIGQDASWTPKNGRERWPTGYITFWVAHDFARWAGLELSTEAEWEKAARNIGGSDGIKYSWGNNPSPDNELCNFGNYIKHPTDVRAYENSWLKRGLANPFGLREMTGNVWEWQDTYWYDGGSEYDHSQDFTNYNSDVIIDERYKELDQLKADGKLSDEEWLTERKKIALKGWRVIKGGSYFDVAAALDASSRIVGDTKVRHSAVGCRFVKR